MFTAHELDSTDLNMSTHAVTRRGHWPLMAASKLGRLVLNQFARCEQGFSRTQGCSPKKEVGTPETRLRRQLHRILILLY